MSQHPTGHPTDPKPSRDSDTDTAESLPKMAVPAVPVVAPPPNGGLVAWLQVLGAFFLAFNTWGLSNTFGVFQSEYSAGFFDEPASDSAISWIGSIQGFLMLVVCVLCGRLLDAGYFYADITLGIFLEVFGMMMTSIATKYYQVLLAQGIAVGIGAGMLFIPALQIVGTYFSTRRSTAMAYAATGSAVGGIVYPILLKRLLRTLGLRWAIRIMAFVMLGTLMIPLAVMRPRLPPRRSGPLVDMDSLRDPAFGIWLLAIFTTFIGLYIPFFYVEKYALNIGVSSDLAFYMLIIINAASLPGRLIGMVADKIGNMTVIIPAVFFSGVATLAWIPADTQSKLIGVSFLLGIASGAIQAVVPGTVVLLCPDLSKLGTNIGMTLGASGFGLLIGSPIAGAIIDSQSSRAGTVYWGAFVFAGVLVVAGSFMMAAVRVIKVGFAIVKA
ncbi:major facilitator superfamily domain-containing protein [Echria macrotheca]|uniref:Major facilitator superfamily domain-containing protein n=1 Tax=Echria macrotheca TaxID=438768 RepID=A0AAJ0BLB3_9PEZI|nr:major facilitator superfamily domain-containing protein [Echria macrotheca]